MAAFKAAWEREPLSLYWTRLHGLPSATRNIWNVCGGDCNPGLKALGCNTEVWGQRMRRKATASSRVFLSWFFAFSFFSVVVLTPPSAAFAAPIDGATASSVATVANQFSPFVKVNVICQRVREGNGTRTYSCPNNNTCVNVGGVWKCRPPVALMSCSVCYANQKRNSDACMRSGTLMQQSACVNRVNGELMTCLGHCQ